VYVEPARQPFYGDRPLVHRPGTKLHLYGPFGAILARIPDDHMNPAVAGRPRRLDVVGVPERWTVLLQPLLDSPDLLDRGEGCLDIGTAGHPIIQIPSNDMAGPVDLRLGQYRHLGTWSSSLGVSSRSRASHLKRRPPPDSSS